MAHYDPNRVYVLVTGANLVIRHQRRTGRVNTQTGRIEKEAPMHISNVLLVGTDGKATRAGYEITGSDKTRLIAALRIRFQNQAINNCWFSLVNLIWRRKDRRLRVRRYG